MSEINDFNSFINKFLHNSEFFKNNGISDDKSFSDYNCESIFDNDNTYTDITESPEEPEKSSKTKAIFNEQGKVIEISFFDDDGNLTITDYYKYDDNGNTLERVSINANGIIEMQENTEYYENGEKKNYSKTFYRSDGTIMDNVEKTFYENGNLATDKHSSYNSDENIKSYTETIYRENGTKEKNISDSYDVESGEKISRLISTYDEHDNVIKTEYCNSDGIAIEVLENEYYDDGTTKSESYISRNNDGSLSNHYEIKYNEYGQPTDYIQYLENGDVSYRKNIIYDNNFNQIEQTIYDGSDNIIQNEEKNYNEKGLLTDAVTYDSSGKIKEKTVYNYDENDNISSKTIYNDKGNVISESNFTYGEFESANEHTQVFDDDGNVIFDFEYEYDFIIGYSFEDDQFIGDAREIYANNKDGEIGYSRQGMLGDCWLLSGINALSYSENGQELLKNAVVNNDDNSYTINFKGLDTSITITEEEIQYARESSMYSNGDDDMLLLELGFEAVLNKIMNGEIEIPEYDNEFLTINDLTDSMFSSIDGGYFEDVIFLLTGNHADYVKYNDDDAGNKIDKVLDKIQENPEIICVNCGFKAQTNDQNSVLVDINGDYIYTITPTGHAFSIKSVDGEKVTIVNPFDSSKEYVISRDTLKSLASDVQYYEY